MHAEKCDDSAIRLFVHETRSLPAAAYAGQHQFSFFRAEHGNAELQSVGGGHVIDSRSELCSLEPTPNAVASIAGMSRCDRSADCARLAELHTGLDGHVPDPRP